MNSDVVEHIPTDKHVMVCGMTGTGKSYLAEKYLTGYDYVVKLDTKDETGERRKKGQSAWDGLEEGKDFSVVRSIDGLDDCETDKIIYVPSFDEQDENTFNEFFRWCFMRENTLIWIDELMSIGTSMRYPKELGRVYTQGRSKNVGIWACTQRPAGIPVISTANTTYFFVFDLMLPNDRKRMVDATGMPQLMELPQGHNFWYYKMGMREPIKAVLVN